jgi:hypothetical protein
VGNQDIIDLIHSSIDKFQWQGLVGAGGHMNCQTSTEFDGGYLPISWGTVHSSRVMVLVLVSSA